MLAWGHHKSHGHSAGCAGLKAKRAQGSHRGRSLSISANIIYEKRRLGSEPPTTTVCCMPSGHVTGLMLVSMYCRLSMPSPRHQRYPSEAATGSRLLTGLRPPFWLICCASARIRPKAAGRGPRWSVPHSKFSACSTCRQMVSSDRNATTMHTQMGYGQQHGGGGIRLTDGGCCWRSLRSDLLWRAAWAATVDAGDLALVARVLAAAPPQGPPSGAASEPYGRCLCLSVTCPALPVSLPLTSAKEVRCGS